MPIGLKGGSLLHADSQAEGLKVFFVVGTVIEIEQWLKALVSGIIFVFTELQCLR